MNTKCPSRPAVERSMGSATRNWRQRPPSLTSGPRCRRRYATGQPWWLTTQTSTARLAKSGSARWRPTPPFVGLVRLPWRLHLDSPDGRRLRSGRCPGCAGAHARNGGGVRARVCVTDRRRSILTAEKFHSLPRDQVDTIAHLFRHCIRR